MYNIKEEDITDFIVVSKTGIEEEFLDCRLEIEYSTVIPPILIIYDQYDYLIAVFNDFDYFRMI